MNIIKTKYGDLNGARIIGRYNTGEEEYYSVEERSELSLLGYKLIPLYGELKERRKDLPALRFYKSGNIKTISLNDQTLINTKIGNFSVEKIVFYEEGEIKRLFLLDGKLSGYWGEEDEYKLATEYTISTKFGDLTTKLISLQFYRLGNIKSLTLWPRERIRINVNDIAMDVRIGVSFYENGEIKSCEPAIPTSINTPIGTIEAFDKSAIGIHGENNSLNFNEDGSIKSMITSTNKIEVTNRDGKKDLYSPRTVRKYVGDMNTTIPILIEFYNDIIIINKDNKYKINENSFEINSLIGNTLTLKGDL